MRLAPNSVDGLMLVKAATPGIETEIFDSSQLFAATGLNTFGRFRHKENLIRSVGTGEIWIVVGAYTVSIGVHRREARELRRFASFEPS
jgi:hypothetical protein